MNSTTVLRRRSRPGGNRRSSRGATSKRAVPGSAWITAAASGSSRTIARWCPAPRRCALIPGWLSGPTDPGHYSTQLATSAPLYAGFNLLIGDRASLHYASNRTDGFARALSPGVYGLANHILDTPWPKVLRVRRALEQWLAAPDPDLHALFPLLADRHPATDGNLPETGLSPEWERALSAPFVAQGGYGTRCSTVLAISHDDSLQIDEHRFAADGKLTGTASFRLAPREWPAV